MDDCNSIRSAVSPGCGTHLQPQTIPIQDINHPLPTCCFPGQEPGWVSVAFASKLLPGFQDPSRAAPVFRSKQLYLQPLLSQRSCLYTPHPNSHHVKLHQDFTKKKFKIQAGLFLCSSLEAPFMFTSLAQYDPSFESSFKSYLLEHLNPH